MRIDSWGRVDSNEVGPDEKGRVGSFGLWLR